MSWGVALRNAVGLGLGGIPSLRKSGPYPKISFDFTKGTLDPLITFTRASSATYFDSAGVLKTAANDVARFDYDPSTLAALGLFIEEQRTNLCLYSEDLNQAIWTKGANVTTTYNTTVAPDGATTADTLTVSNAGANNGVFQSITVSASTSYVYSWWVKLGTLAVSDFKFGIYNNTAAAWIAQDVVPTQTPSSSAWTRISYAFTTPVGCTSIRIYVFRNSSSIAGTLNVWGMQLEAGAFSTSYIPTTTTALTRSADVATISGTNFTSWFRQMYGTFYVEYQGVNNVAGATRRAIEVSNSGSTTDRYVFGYQATTTSRLFVVQNNATQADIYVTSVTQSNVVKTAAAYAADDIRTTSNGTLGTPDTSATLPTVSQLWFGTAEGSAANTVLNGYMRKFAFYPEPLRSGTLQALTS